jgi:hypothetical protein
MMTWQIVGAVDMSTVHPEKLEQELSSTVSFEMQFPDFVWLMQ